MLYMYTHICILGVYVYIYIYIYMYIYIYIILHKPWLHITIKSCIFLTWAATVPARALADPMLRHRGLGAAHYYY